MRKILAFTTTLFLASIYLVVASFKNDAVRSRLNADPVKESFYRSYVKSLYEAIDLSAYGLPVETFEKALSGYYNLKDKELIGDKSTIAIADFDQASTKKRLYVIDLENKKLVLNTWVAHGQNSGGDVADRFSNKNESFASSLGFYVTGEMYYGTHGKSMRLDGLDEGFNNNARSRSIVVHGASYVSQGTINALGRLGRSQGCPAVAPGVLEEVLTALNKKTLLFINKSNDTYRSKYLAEPASFGLPIDTALAAI